MRHSRRTAYRLFSLLSPGWSISIWLLFLLGPLAVQAGGDRYVHLKFYSIELTFPAVPEMLFELPEKLDEATIEKAYTHFEGCNYHPFLKKVGDYRRGMRLGDWHFFGIVADYSETVYAAAGRNFQVLFQWFILRKSGIDARLFFTETAIYLHAPSDDIEFGFYTVEKGEKKYMNLTARRDSLQLDNVVAFMPDFVPDQANMPLDMKFSNLPNLPNPPTIDRLLEFTHKGKIHRLHVRLNSDHLQMMDEYPYYNQAHYFQIGLSPEAEGTLLPALEKMLEGKTAVEQVELILSFTRTAFYYRDDKHRYGREKPMTPEQTLYHSYSDCEDRSALFFYICSKLLKLPVIVLDFDSHVGCAVEIPGVEGDYYRYKSRVFSYCEPTGPQDELKPGEMWDKVRAQKARVLLDYLPE